MSDKDTNAEYRKLYSQYLIPKTLEQARTKDYKFWETQPVPELEEIITIQGEIKSKEDFQVKHHRQHIIAIFQIQI